MSWAEEEGYDTYDPTDYDDDFNTWYMKGGKSIAVSDMEISHMKACIKMFERFLRNKPVSYGGPSPDDSDGSFWAQHAEERDNDALEEKIHAWIDRFEDEIRQRMRHQLRGKGEF